MSDKSDEMFSNKACIFQAVLLDKSDEIYQGDESLSDE